MEWDELEIKCLQATVAAIKKLLAENPEENFYAFSLYTDSSAMTVSLSANSEQQVNSILDSEENTSKENQDYYKWTTSEWAYEGVYPDFFNDISKSLRESPDRANFSQFKKNLIQTLINTLKKVKHGELSLVLSASVVFVSITDDDESENIENISAQSINNESITCYFLARYD
ncbi:DUF4303 domain-containing protein [Kosakonia sacchari]|uniref:DUF4303 domain-containing protein n=1 Tax=Kosakonia sacchari TaxID=1158459 RepID=UPI00158591AF|nr:DUF4303 domain-containing protein [Kosakonia sacchari]NUL38958.1 DUF4303 domain-containing protein [Kosakonia sacchari]